MQSKVTTKTPQNVDTSLKHKLKLGNLSNLMTSCGIWTWYSVTAKPHCSFAHPALTELPSTFLLWGDVQKDGCTPSFQSLNHPKNNFSSLQKSITCKIPYRLLSMHSSSKRVQPYSSVILVSKWQLETWFVQHRSFAVQQSQMTQYMPMHNFVCTKRLFVPYTLQMTYMTREVHKQINSWGSVGLSEALVRGSFAHLWGGLLGVWGWVNRKPTGSLTKHCTRWSPFLNPMSER